MQRNKLTALVTGMLVVCGSGDKLRAQEKFTADKVVAVVGNSAVLYSDIDKYSKALIAQRKQQGYTSERDPRCEVLEQQIIQKLLYNQSQIDSLDIPMERIEEVVQSNLDDEIVKHGSVAVLEMFYHKPIFSIREDLKERYKESSGANEMENTIRNKVHVTPGEVEKFYKKLPKDSLPIIPEQYVYSQIVLYPSNVEDAKLRTKERLLELRERILGGARFDMLARTYSQDAQSAIRGGDMGLSSKDIFVPPFAEALSKLKPGQVSGVVETMYGFHLIHLIDKIGNQYHVSHILLKPQYTDQDLEAPYDKLDSLQKRIVAGEMTFEEAVKENSQDKYSKQNGGLVSNLEQLEIYNVGDPTEASTKFYTEYLNPEDYKVLQKLKPGEVSAPFASQDMLQNLLCKVVRLEKVIPAHPADLKEDYLQIERMALAEKQNKAFVEWLREKSAGMYIRIDDEFRGCDFMYDFLLK